MQDNIANLVAASISRLLEIEINTRISSRPPASLSSYEQLLRGYWYMKKMSPVSTVAAQACFQRAVDLDPGNAEALCWLGITYCEHWIEDFSAENAVCGARLCSEAVAIDPANAHLHTLHAFSRLCVNDLDGAVHAIERGMALNPGDSNVIANRALVFAFEGNRAEARRMINMALALDPMPPIWFGEFLGVIAFAEGNYEESAAGVEAVPDCAWDMMYALACYGHLGHRDKAAAVLARMKSGGRTHDFLYWANREPFRHPEPRSRLVEGLELALAESAD